MRKLKLSTFMSVNSSSIKLGVLALQLCAFYAQWLEQKLPDNLVNIFTFYTKQVSIIKTLGFLMMYLSPARSTAFSIVIPVLLKPGRLFGHWELSNFQGLLEGSFTQNCLLYTSSSSSGTSKRPFKTICAAVVLATFAAICEETNN